MTIGDLIQIANDEGSDPNELQLAISIGGTYFELITSDEQDRFNPNIVAMTIVPMNEKEGK